jgi:type IV pilus assembly protein PilM
VEEQSALIRFRLKRTVPFDVDTAILRYQTRSRGGNKVDLTVAAIAVETLAPYEAAFRNAGFHPGFVTIAGLSAANLAAPDSLTLRLSGLTLTISHFEGEELRLFRCLELQSGTLDEILNVLDPTLAYLEDERKTKPNRIDVCGLGELQQELQDHLRTQWNVDLQPLRSRLGAVDANNAGLYGYLESMGVN